MPLLLLGVGVLIWFETGAEIRMLPGMVLGALALGALIGLLFGGM